MESAASNPITGQPYSMGYAPGTDSGAITLTWRTDRILLATVRPHRDPSGPRYIIEANRCTGHVRCSCDAYRYAREQRGGTHATITDQTSGWCKHIRAWYEAIATEIIERNEAVDQEKRRGVDERFAVTPDEPLDDYWRAMLDRYPLGSGHPDVAVIDGQFYRIGPENIDKPFLAPPSWKAHRGHGGRRFVIRFYDGRTVETTNLWAAGDIPDRLRALFCDNAGFDGRTPPNHRASRTPNQEAAR